MGVNAPEVLDAAECILDQVALAIGPLVVDDFAFPVDAPRNDRNEAAQAKLLAD